MDIKGLPGSIKPASTESLTLPKASSTSATIENWKTNQILKAVVTQTNSRLTQMIIEGVLVETPTAPKLKLEVGQQLLLQVEQSRNMPSLKIISLQDTQQIVNSQLRNELPRQHSMTQLFADLKSIASQPYIQKSLSSEIIKQVQQIINALPQAPKLNNADSIKQALNNSGIFLENNIVKSNNPDIHLNTDLRALLLRLAQVLKLSSQTMGLTGQRPGTASQDTLMRATSLIRQLPQPQPPVTARLLTQATLESFKQELLQQVESALARIHSLQLFSVKVDDSSNPLWAMELPVRYQENIDIFDLRIQAEEHNDKDDDTTRRWSVTLSFSLDGIGPVFVRVYWYQQQLSATFWIEETHSNALFHNYIEVLKQRLLKAGLNLGEINIAQGRPDIPPSPPSASLLDEQA